MNTPTSIRLHLSQALDHSLFPFALVLLFLVPTVALSSRLRNAAKFSTATAHLGKATTRLSNGSRSAMASNFALAAPAVLLSSSPTASANSSPTPSATPTSAPTAEPKYAINPDKVQTGKTRDVTISTDTGDLSKVDPQAPPLGSGITFEAVAGQTVQHPNNKAIVIRVEVDEDADLGTVPITLTRTEADGSTHVEAVVNLEVSEFKPRRISRGPTPDDIDQVDAMWNVLPVKIVKTNFGRRAADSFYGIEVFIGNNSGYDLQIVGVGFNNTLGRPNVDTYDNALEIALDKDKNPLRDEHGNILVRAKDKNGQPMTTTGKPDGPPLYRPLKTYHMPTSDHRLVRGSIEFEQLYGRRALALNLIGGVGTFLSGFVPFFHALGPRANFSTFSSIVNGQLKEGFGIAAPDLTVSQLNRLENLVLRDGLVIPNNSQAKTIVFFPRNVINLTEDEKRTIDKGIGMYPVMDKLGELVIVGKPLITFKNREIVATRPPSTLTPPTPSAPTAAAPTITGVLLNEGNGPGKNVLITGTNFTSGSTVTFGGVPATNVTFDTPTQITAKIPAEAMTGKVKVGAAESPNDFVAQPRITGVDPKNAAPGAPVTIKGANLDTATSVKFGSVAVPAANFTLKEKDKIIVKVPPGAESGILVVEAPASVGNATAPVAEKFVAEPVLDPLATNRGKTDERITITGKNLDNAEVKFGNVIAEVVNPGSTSIEIKVPANAVSGPITVKTPGGEKKTTDFAFIPKPTLTDFSINNGPRLTEISGKTGDTLVITGQNLNNVTGVKFGDTAATFANNTDTQITVTVPADLEGGKIKITITTPGGDATTDKFTFTPKPVLTGFAVNGTDSETASGKIGDTVVLVGKNLKALSKMTFGGTQVTPTNKEDTRITFVVPPGAAPGTVTIKITTPGGDTTTDKFTVTQ
jgi:IPT/TIG domain